MRLQLLHEEVQQNKLDIKGMELFSGMWHIVVQQVDDSNQLVAYRLHHGTRVQCRWAVSFMGQLLAFIVKADSQWVHDNFECDIRETNPRILTMQNHKYIRGKLDDLRILVIKKYREKQSELVVMPIDLSKVLPISAPKLEAGTV